jgi:hypothetical protein
MPLAERKKRRISKLTVFGRILFYLGILKIWYETDPRFNWRTYSCEKVNGWNPLSYIMVLFFIIRFTIIGFFEGVVESRDLFKTKKYNA